MNSLKIGQITDMHFRHHLPGASFLSSRRSREVHDLIPKALKYFKSEAVDFIALTGDLVDIPNCDERKYTYYPSIFEGYEARAEQDYRWLKEQLDQTGIPYSALPGNHDVDEVFWRVFNPDITCQDLTQGYQVVSFYDREWDAHVPWRIDRERKLMEKVLGEQGHERQIHLQHYAITPHCPGSYPHNYGDSEDIMRRIASSKKVVLSLSGHYHKGSDLTKAGDCHFSIGPTFSESPHPVRIYHLEDRKVSYTTKNIQPTPLSQGKACVFLDRDGVILTKASYNTGPWDAKLIPGAAQAIKKLHEAGLIVIVITNQTCVGEGYVPLSVLNETHDHMNRQLMDETKDALSQPDLILSSYGAGENAANPAWQDLSRNKPSAALLEEAHELMKIDRDKCWMVGDRYGDYQCANSFGAKFHLVQTGDGKLTKADMSKEELENIQTGDSIVEVADDIIAQLG